MQWRNGYILLRALYAETDILNVPGPLDPWCLTPPAGMHKLEPQSLEAMTGGMCVPTAVKVLGGNGETEKVFCTIG